MEKFSHLDGLNPQQKEGVQYGDGPLLLVAGAGSGKTKVLTSRIVNLIKVKKIFPNQILAVTFTNKAAKEMKIRVAKFLSKDLVELAWNFSFNLCKNFKKTC